MRSRAPGVSPFVRPLLASLAALPILAAPLAGQSPRAGAHEIIVVAHEYSLSLPDSVAAGIVTFHLRNEGREAHNASLYRIEGPKTLRDVLAAEKSNGRPPPWMQPVGGPGAVLPGDSSIVTLTLSPGRYAVLCDLPADDGTAHVMKGMIRELTVVPAGRVAPAPVSDITIGLVDFGFQLSRSIARGKHVIRVENRATQPHELVLFRLVPGKTVDDLLTFLDKHDGAPPVEWAGGTTSIAPGITVYVRANLTPGQYGLLCFLSDEKDGQSHVAHGMRKEFTIQ